MGKRKVWATQRDLTLREAETLSAACDALERAVAGVLLGFIAQDDGGIYVTFRPGVETDVARVLAEADWSRGMHVVEEWSQ